MAKNRALGRGLGSLIPSGESRENLPPRDLELDLLETNPDQPRGIFEEESLVSLARSIQVHGVLQPLLVRPSGEGFRIIAGERRWRAARMAGLGKVPVHVLEGADEQDLERALLENVQREDLSPLEVAEAFERLMSRSCMTQERLARVMGWSRPAVANKLRLLSLPEGVRLMLAEGRLTEGHCRALLAVEDSDELLELARETVRSGYSVRKLEERVRRRVTDRSSAKLSCCTGPLNDRCEELSRRWGVTVRLSGKGTRKSLTLRRLEQESLEKLLDLLDEAGGDLFPGK